MILLQVIQVLVALLLHLSQGCQLRYTRKALARKSQRGGGGRSKDFKQAIPGRPWRDYPDYDAIPKTSFSCDKRMNGGYYGDPATRCQVYHICSKDGKTGRLTKKSVLCPKGTQFQQKDFVCDWWFNVDCSTTKQFYKLNKHKGRRKGRATNSVQQEIECARGDPVTGRRTGYLENTVNIQGGSYYFKTNITDECENHCKSHPHCQFYVIQADKNECLLKASDGIFKCHNDFVMGPRNRPNDQSAFSAGKACTNPCSGAECKNVKAMLGHLIDFSVDPCSDFFAFACSTKTRGTTPPVAPRRIELYQELVANPPTGFEYIQKFYQSCTEGWPKKTTKEVFSSCMCTENELEAFGAKYIVFLRLAKIIKVEFSFCSALMQVVPSGGQICD